MAKRRAKTAYHHGDLAAAALEAAQRILDEEGAGAIGIRRVAADVGVSPMALYNHFDGKESLVFALAEAAFHSLRASLDRAAPAGSPPLERLENGAVAYVLFAVEHRERFALMFGGLGEAIATHPRLHDAAGFAFSPLVECLAECSRLGLLRGSPVAAERAIWSAAHGYAALWNTVPGLMRGDRSSIEANCREMLALILGGL